MNFRAPRAIQPCDLQRSQMLSAFDDAGPTCYVMIFVFLANA